MRIAANCARTELRPYNRIRSVATVSLATVSLGRLRPFGRPQKTLYCGSRRRNGKTNERLKLRLRTCRYGERGPRNRILTMDNPEKQSKWDELARELGAEAPPVHEVAAPPKSTYVTEAGQEAPRRKVVEPPPRPKASPKSWDNLAADFGLEVPPPPSPPTSAPSAPSRAQVESPPPRESSPLQESPPPREAVSKRTEERPPRRQRPPRREQSTDAEDRPARPPRREREEPPRRDREDSPRHAREAPPRQVREEPPRPAPAPEPEPASKPAPSMGVSLWHKIFGSPDQQAERIAESASSPEITSQETSRHSDSEESRDQRSREDRHNRRGRRNEEPRADRDREEVEEVSESWQQETVDVSLTEAADAEEGAERPTDENGEPRKRRRRRGRGRGRGRRPEGEPSGGGEERSEAQAENRSDKPSAPRGPREPRAEREPRGRGGRPSRPRREVSRKPIDPKDDLDDGLEEIVLDDDNDTDEMDLGIDGEDSAESTGRDVPAGHKSIPSWDEAIGMIVDTNLATRTDRRRSSSPQSRDSGSSRGRSRGGRRRKKS